MAFPSTLRKAAALAFVCVGVGVPAQTVAGPLTFDVASIHVNTSQTDGRNHIYSDSRESRFRTVNLSLRDLIQFAYVLPKSQIVGGPAWLDFTRFDIDARSDPSADAQLHGLPSKEAQRRKQVMVQALLADRFHLEVHQEIRQLPVYSLVNAKGGPRFKPSEINGTTIDTGQTRLHIAGSDDTLNLLARELALQLRRPVLNQTGLSGRYDLNLRWTGDDSSASAPSSPDTPPDLFTAIQEQLGLKLESTKGPVPVLVVDGAEMSSPN